MARRRYAFRIPFIGRKITTMQALLGLGGLGLLYYVLANRDVGIPFIDQPLEAFGDITGLEGRGQSILPSIFGAPPAPVAAAPPAAAAAEAGWNDWRFTNAYPAFENYDEMRFSNAYKNE